MLDERPWNSLRPVVPEGMHLRYSKDNTGRFRALLFEDDTNKMAGPPELEEIEDDRRDESEYMYGPQPIASSSDSNEEPTLGELVALAVVTVGIAGIVRAAPHVILWWQERALPSMTKTWSRLVASRGPKSAQRPEATELEVFSETATEDFSTAVGFAIQDHREPMSMQEAGQRLAEMLAAAAFIAQQMRLLSNARLEDVPAFPTLSHAMERLTTQWFTDRINRLLESSPDPLDDGLSVQLMTFFGGGGRDVDGKYIPLRSDRVRDVLRLPPDQQLRGDAEGEARG